MIDFTIANIEIYPFILFLFAFILSFFTSMGGASGASLRLPFQIRVWGYASPPVSATSQRFYVMAIPGRVFRYVKEKSMLWPLALPIILGSLPGGLVGSWIRIQVLPNPDKFQLFASTLLLVMGARFITSIWQRRDENITIIKDTPSKFARVSTRCNRGRCGYQKRTYQSCPLLKSIVSYFTSPVTFSAWVVDQS